MAARFLHLGDRTIDRSIGEVRDFGGTVRGRLSPKELALLNHLVDSSPRACGPDELLTKVWGYTAGVETRTVIVTLARLRAKVEINPSEPTHLLAVSGAGYRFVHPPPRDSSTNREFPANFGGLTIFRTPFSIEQVRRLLDSDVEAPDLEPAFGLEWLGTELRFRPASVERYEHWRLKAARSERRTIEQRYAQLMTTEVRKTLEDPDITVRRVSIEPLRTDLEQLAVHAERFPTAARGWAMVGLAYGCWGDRTESLRSWLADLSVPRTNVLYAHLAWARGVVASDRAPQLALENFEIARKEGVRLGDRALAVMSALFQIRLLAAGSQSGAALETAAWVDQFGDERSRVRVAQFRIYALANEGRLEEAVRCGRRMLPEAEKLETDLVNLRVSLAHVLELAGEYEEAYRTAKQALSDAVLLRHSGWTLHVLQALVPIAFASGRHAEALSSLQEALRLGDSGDRSEEVALVRLTQAEFALAHGEFVGGRALIAQVGETISTGATALVTSYFAFVSCVMELLDGAYGPAHQRAAAADQSGVVGASLYEVEIAAALLLGREVGHLRQPPHHISLELRRLTLCLQEGAALPEVRSLTATSYRSVLAVVARRGRLGVGALA